VLTINNLHFEAGPFSLELSVELHRKVTGLYGPSGSGKTTLLEIIAGLKRPRKGCISLGNRELFNGTTGTWVKPESRQVGYVPQDLALFPHKTTRANLLYGSPIDQSEFGHIVSEFQLEPLLDRFPHGLSGGEKQRVAIGRALMTKPRFLMLDEPLSSLDQPLKSRALDFFRRLKESFQVPILYVSHDASELGEICDEVVVLAAGRIISQGKISEVFAEVQETRYYYRKRLE